MLGYSLSWARFYTRHRSTWPSPAHSFRQGHLWRLLAGTTKCKGLSCECREHSWHSTAFEWLWYRRVKLEIWESGRVRVIMNGRGKFAICSTVQLSSLKRHRKLISERSLKSTQLRSSSWLKPGREFEECQPQLYWTPSRCREPEIWLQIPESELYQSTLTWGTNGQVHTASSREVVPFFDPKPQLRSSRQ